MECICRGCQKRFSTQETAVLKDGLLYCCMACAKGTGCTCKGAVRGPGFPGRSLRRAAAPPLEAYLNERWS